MKKKKNNGKRARHFRITHTYWGTMCVSPPKWFHRRARCCLLDKKGDESKALNYSSVVYGHIHSMCSHCCNWLIIITTSTASQWLLLGCFQGYPPCSHNPGSFPSPSPSRNWEHHTRTVNQSGALITKSVRICYLGGF